MSVSVVSSVIRAGGFSHLHLTEHINERRKMHVAINAWFWDQPFAGSGQYVVRLVSALRAARPDIDLTLVMPPHIRTPERVPAGVSVHQTGGFGGKVGKVWFEQRTFPRAVARLKADIAHVPYWGPPLSSPARW